MKSLFPLFCAGCLFLSDHAFAGWPAAPETVKSTGEVFSYYEKYKSSNSRLEWARFSRQQGELFVVLEYHGHVSPLWASMVAYRRDGDEWHRVVLTQFEKLSGDISVEFRRATDKMVIRDAERVLKSFTIVPANTTKP